LLESGRKGSTEAATALRHRTAESASASPALVTASARMEKPGVETAVCTMLWLLARTALQTVARCVRRHPISTHVLRFDRLDRVETLRAATLSRRYGCRVRRTWAVCLCWRRRPCA
jgi:hypothetical protein